MSCKHTVPCGCKDTALPMGSPCSETGDCSGTPCSEIFCSECILYCGEPFRYGSPLNGFDVEKGDSFLEIIQRMSALYVDADCGESVAAALRVTSKTSTTITLSWIGDGASTYEVQWGASTALVGVGVTSYVITGLTPDTSYTITIENTDTSCLSVALTVKTNE